MLCNSLFSQTNTAPKAQHILPASHPRLNLSPIRKSSFPPWGQIQGPQAARWLHSFRANQTGETKPIPSSWGPRFLPTKVRGLAPAPQPRQSVSPALPPWQASPGPGQPRPRPAPNACRPPAARCPGCRGRQSGPAPHASAGGRGELPGDPRAAARPRGQGRSQGSEPRPPAPWPSSRTKWSRPGHRQDRSPTRPRHPFLGLRPGARQWHAGGGLARVPPLLGPAHKEPRCSPAPAPRPGPQRERPRRRRTGRPEREGGHEGGECPRPRRRWRRGRRREETDISFELKWSRFRSDHWPKRDTNLQCSPGWLPSPIGCLVGQKMAAKEPVPARSSASSTRPPLPPPRAASLRATPSLRSSRSPALRSPAPPGPTACAEPPLLRQVANWVQAAGCGF